MIRTPKVGEKNFINYRIVKNKTKKTYINGGML